MMLNVEEISDKKHRLFAEDVSFTIYDVSVRYYAIFYEEAGHQLQFSQLKSVGTSVKLGDRVSAKVSGLVDGVSHKFLVLPFPSQANVKGKRFTGASSFVI